MMAALHNHPLPLTLADLEFDRMTQANVFNHRIHTIKEEATIAHTDDVRPKAKKKNGKRVSWGPSQIKEIEPFKNINYWHSVGDKENAGIEKRCEQFWETGHGHRFRWTINEKRWNRCSQIWDEMDELIAKKGVWDTWDNSVFKGGLL
jgi:hypothetical protein